MKRTIIGVLCVTVLAAACLAAEPGKPSPPNPRRAKYTKQTIEGWTVRVNAAFIAERPRISANTIKEIRFQLRRMTRPLPADKVRMLQTVPIWVEEENKAVDGTVVFHPTEKWLAERKLNTDKAGAVEIADARGFLKRSLVQPGLLLYVFADALHWRLFRFNSPEITAAYETLKKSDTFNDVTDAAGKKGAHHGLANARAFFNEFSQTYFARGTMYPFMRAQLQRDAPEVAQAIVDAWYRPVGYVPTKKYLRREIEGWTVFINPHLAADDPKLLAEVLGEIEVQLNRVRRLLPADKVKILRRTKIWVEAYGIAATCAAFHPDRRWLEENGVNPDKAQGIEVTNARNFADWTKNGMPWILFHELSHAYHWNMFRYKHPKIDAAYKGFVERHGGKQDEDGEDVKPEGVLEYTGAVRPPYALKSAMEYFAEASEAYFDCNEIYPFVRSELEQFDPETAKLVREIWYGPVPKAPPEPDEAQPRVPTDR